MIDKLKNYIKLILKSIWVKIVCGILFTGFLNTWLFSTYDFKNSFTKICAFFGIIFFLSLICLIIVLFTHIKAKNRKKIICCIMLIVLCISLLALSIYMIWPIKQKNSKIYTAPMASSDTEETKKFINKLDSTLSSISDAYHIETIIDSNYVKSHNEGLNKGKCLNADIIQTIMVKKIINSKHDSIIAEISVPKESIKYKYGKIKIKWNPNSKIPESFLTEPKIAASLFKVHHLYMDDEFSEAIKLLNTIRKENVPNTSNERKNLNLLSIYQWLGTIYSEKFLKQRDEIDRENAINNYEKAITYQPKYAELHILVANLYFRRSYLDYDNLEFKTFFNDTREKIILELEKARNHYEKFITLAEGYPNYSKEISEAIINRRDISNFLTRVKNNSK